MTNEELARALGIDPFGPGLSDWIGGTASDPRMRQAFMNQQATVADQVRAQQAAHNLQYGKQFQVIEMKKTDNGWEMDDA
jgi:hypothetical protein